ncbi:hypothetical protein [Bauldia sp.]|uniref:hypothetical protein n=1 Tax=Bauldia sp. TaxID=2575872 RepID=UPI003BABB521
MIVIQMPGGDVEYVRPVSLLWMREAFDWEIAGTVMLRIGSTRLYASETMAALTSKFSTAGISLSLFTAPEGSIRPAVNVAKVNEVEAANPVFHHDNAHSVLKFSPQLGLAVRESVEEAREKLNTPDIPAGQGRDDLTSS